MYLNKNAYLFAKTDHPSVFHQGGHDHRLYDGYDMIVGHDQSYRITINTPAVREVYGIFLAFDYAGVLDITQHGGHLRREQMYSMVRYMRVVPLSITNTPSRKTIEISSTTKHALSRAHQIAFLGVLINKECDTSPEGFTAIIPELEEIDPEEFKRLQQEMVIKWGQTHRDAGHDMEEVSRQRFRLYRQRFQHMLTYTKPGDAILDVGSGYVSEEILDDLFGHGIAYHSHDIDDKVVEYMKRQFTRRKYPTERVVCADNTTLDYPAGKFNLLFTSHCFEHSRDLHVTMAKTRSILADDGVLFLAVPFGWDFATEHVYNFDVEDWLYLLRFYGFDILSYHIGKEYLEHGYDLIIVAKKLPDVVVPQITENDYRSAMIATYLMAQTCPSLLTSVKHFVKRLVRR